MRFSHGLSSFVLAIALAGCQAQGLAGVGAGGGAADGGAGQPAGKPAVGVGAPGAIAPDRLGAFTFQPLSASAAARLSSRASGGARAEAAPAAPPAPSAGKVAADSSMMVVPGSPYAHGTYFSGPYGPMKLESATEARGPGSAGGWADIKAEVVAPVLAAWAADARLIASRGMLDGDGNTAQGAERWPGELGWRATYAAPGRNEVLEFHVTAAGTTITRLRWAPIDLNLDAAGVDAKAALAAISAAIGDADARSEEDRLGHDYFFGKDGGPVSIATGVAEPALVPPDTPVQGPVGEPARLPAAGPTPQPVYTLKAGGRWSAGLSAIGDKVIWELHYDPGEDAWQPPVDGWSADPTAYGMVDARTGALIRFRRPSRFFVGDQDQRTEPHPIP